MKMKEPFPDISICIIDLDLFDWLCLYLPQWFIACRASFMISLFETSQIVLIDTRCTFSCYKYVYDEIYRT